MGIGGFTENIFKLNYLLPSLPATGDSEADYKKKIHVLMFQPVNHIQVGVRFRAGWKATCAHTLYWTPTYNVELNAGPFHHCT